MAWSCASITLAFTALVCACAEDPSPNEGVDEAAVTEGGEPSTDAGAASELPPETTVADAVKKSCSTEVVRGLSLQMIDAVVCLSPDLLVRMPARPTLAIDPVVHPYLHKDALPSFLAAVDELAAKSPSSRLEINSAFRVLPQQFMVAAWGKRRRCGVQRAAAPGESKHESGLAVDIANYSVARKAFGRHDFAWFGARDRVHFHFTGGDGGASVTTQSVLAFQKLWNANHPADLLPETGTFDDATEARLEGSPVGGFAKGLVCPSIVTP